MPHSFDLTENPRDPFDLFTEWFLQAQETEQNDPNAMCLSTVGADGRPSSRMVLLKDHNPSGFTFFTNSLSRKGKELEHNHNVALLFHWKTLLRQVRIEGHVETITRLETTRYFQSRARESQIASYASKQSEILSDKTIYEQAIDDVRQEFEHEDNIPCPDHWNGYRVIPSYIEFWMQRDYRTHDRFEFVKKGDEWIIHRLYP